MTVSASASSNNPAATPASSSAQAPLRSLFLHTHNVARNLKPSPDGELANSLHETLHFALDGEEEDWGIRNDQVDEAASRDCNGTNGTGHSASVDGSALNGNGQAAAAAAAADGMSQSAVANPSSPSSKANPPSATSSSTLPANRSQNLKESQSQSQYQDGPKARRGFFPSSNPARPYISYAWDSRTQTLSLPNPTLISNPTQLDPCSPERRNDFDVTAKFFFLDKVNDGKGFKPEHIDQALRRLMLTTGLITVDTLILAFPTLQFDHFGQRDNKAPCGTSSERVETQAEKKELTAEEQESLDRNIQHVKKVWQAVSPNPQCVSLGLSDFSLPALKSLFNSFSPPPPSPPTSSPTSSAPNNSTKDSASADKLQVSAPLSSSASDSISSTYGIPVIAPPVDEHEVSSSSAFTTPSDTRRPRVVTINVKEDPCSFDRDLSAWCNKEGMQVLSHGDRRDILPAHTLNSLLSEFTSDLPHPLPSDKPLRARWVLKYSVLIESRGVLADRGYIVYADCEE